MYIYHMRRIHMIWGLQGWVNVVGDQADVAFCLVYECGEAELERRLLDRGKSSGQLCTCV